MNRKFYFSFLAFALTLVATVAFVIGHGTRTRAASTNAALSALPASDFIVSIDVQRALNETLPSVLAANPALLAKLNANLKEFEDKTGISPLVFESVAIGSSLNPTAPSGRRDSSSIVIARGHFKSDELLNTAFAAAQKECQFEKVEEQYEGRTIFLIGTVRRLKNESKTGKSSDPSLFASMPYDRFGDPRQQAKKASDSKEVKTQSPESADEQYLTHVEVSLSGHDKFAITALDSNTIAVGSPESVRAAIDASLGRNRVDDELVQLALQSPNAVVSFSGKIPQSIYEKTSSQTSGNPFAKYFASIRQFYGSFGINGSEAETFIALRTENAAQAQDISQAINSLKVLAAFGINQSAGPGSISHDAFAAALKGLSVTSQDNEVRIDAKIPQAIFVPLIRVH